MRIVYAISAGGSTMDVLGIFEDRAMAEEVIADWRTHMGVHDDGWDIEELTVWDRFPTHWTLWTETASTINPKFKITLDKEEIYEWSEQKSRATVVKDYSGTVHFNLQVQGEDLDDVQKTMQAELEARGFSVRRVSPIPTQ